MPVFRPEVWLAGLTAGILLLIALSPAAFRGSRWLRPIGCALAVLMCANAVGHILCTIAGRTVAEVRFPRPMPGFYSSPPLAAASVWLLVRLWRTRSVNAPPA